MDRKYPVLFAGSQVGEVTLRREGAQQVLHCRCDVSGDVMMQLNVLADGTERKIGVLAASFDGYTIDHRENGTGSDYFGALFYLTVRHCAMDGRYCAPAPQHPAKYVRRMESVFLSQNNPAPEAGNRVEKYRQKVEINA